MSTIENYDLAGWQRVAADACNKIETRLFINGNYVDAAQGGRFETINPANGEVIAAMSAGTLEDIDKAFHLIKNIQAGICWVNCYEGGDMTQPFGGYKQSGNARDNCIDSYKSYTQSKSAWIQLAQQ